MKISFYAELSSPFYNGQRESEIGKKKTPDREHTSGRYVESFD